MLLPRLGINVFRGSARLPLSFGRSIYPTVRSFSLIGRKPLPSSLSPRSNTILGQAQFIQTRQFHFSRPLRINNRPPNFRAYNVSPITMTLAFVGMLSLMFFIVPFIFTFFFPLIIAGLVAYQFKRWKNNALFAQLHSSLQRTQLKVSYSSLSALQTSVVNNMLKNERLPGDMFEAIKTQMKNNHMWTDDTAKERANRTIQFLESRVLEAFQKDEGGIRQYFLGNDVASWVKDGYDLELDSRFFKTRGRNFNGSLIMVMSYPLYLVSTGNERRLLAEVSIVFSDNNLTDGSQPFKFLSELAKEDKKCPMIINVKSTRTLFPRQFIIATMGESGQNMSNFSVHTMKDGHRQFTYHE